MDSTMVNFAIEKLNEAFQAIKPTAMELGSEYVEYVVYKATMWPFLWGIMFLVCLAGGGIIFFLATRKEPLLDDDFSAGFLLLFICGTVASVLFLFLTIPHAIFANAYPLMYTIEQLAK